MDEITKRMIDSMRSEMEEGNPLYFIIPVAILIFVLGTMWIYDMLL